VKALERAAELASSDASVGWRALGGIHILHRAGQRDAEIRFLRRACAVTDDPERKKDCDDKLAKLLGEEELAKYRARQRRFFDAWQSEMPFLSDTAMRILGPKRDADYCAGGAHDSDVRCAWTWKRWTELRDAE
jgi:hypothetical protein